MISALLLCAALSADATGPVVAVVPPFTEQKSGSCLVVSRKQLYRDGVAGRIPVSR